MAKVCIFLADGFEETEAITVADILKRGEIEVELVSVSDELKVSSAHKIGVFADKLFSEVDFEGCDMIFLPGGMPGTTNLKKHEGLRNQILKFNEENKRIGAICAGPTVLGELGILKGHKATCYPGCEDALLGAEAVCDPVVTSGNITTSRGVGTALYAGLEIVSLFKGKEKADFVAKDIVMK